jgi:hypothetical protein
MFHTHGKSRFSIDRFEALFLADYELSCGSPKIAEASVYNRTTGYKMSIVCSDTVARDGGYLAIHFGAFQGGFGISVSFA